MTSNKPFFSRRAWVAIYQIICNKHGMDRDKLRSLTPEAHHILVQEALKDMSYNQKRLIRNEYGGSYTKYKNHCAQQHGFKNTYEQRKANWEKRGFAHPQDYYNHWAQKKGFADFWHYRKDLKEKKAQSTQSGLTALYEETKALLEAGNQGQTESEVD